MHAAAHIPCHAGPTHGHVVRYLHAADLKAGQVVRYHPHRAWERVESVRMLSGTVRVDHVGTAPRFTSPSARVEVATG